MPSAQARNAGTTQQSAGQGFQLGRTSACRRLPPASLLRRCGFRRQVSLGVRQPGGNPSTGVTGTHWITRLLWRSHMSAATPRLLDVIAAIGLALGGVCGLSGTVVGRAELRQALWALDGVGLVV